MTLFIKNKKFFSPFSNLAWFQKSDDNRYKINQKDLFKFLIIIDQAGVKP